MGNEHDVDYDPRHGEKRDAWDGGAQGLPLGIYVHVPFCVRKCYYCDFNSYSLDRDAVETYLEALGREIDLVRDEIEAQGFSSFFDTLFIGGGTPTCLSGKDLSWLVHRVSDAFPLTWDAEITCEANPGSSNADKFRSLHAAGVNRLSIGAQSMDDGLLQAIGRTHSAADVVESFWEARDAGFENINLDLMFALPNQTMDQWKRTLDEILALQPDHLSCYSLIIEEGTPFGDRYALGQLPLPGEDAEADMYQYCIETLTQAGYEHYEISNFALPGKRSVHNQIYWRIGRYLGLGPGAHGYWNDVRYSNLRLPQEYADTLQQGKRPIDSETHIDRSEEMDDTMIFGLRLLDGVRLDDFERRFNTPLQDVYAPQIERLTKQGLLVMTDGYVRLTDKGLPLANRVFAEFLR